jgi:general stress protein CsbA
VILPFNLLSGVSFVWPSSAGNRHRCSFLLWCCYKLFFFSLVNKYTGFVACLLFIFASSRARYDRRWWIISRVGNSFFSGRFRFFRWFNSSAQTWGNNPNCGVLLLQVGLSFYTRKFSNGFILFRPCTSCLFPSVQIAKSPSRFLGQTYKKVKVLLELAK